MFVRSVRAWPFPFTDTWCGLCPTGQVKQFRQRPSTPKTSTVGPLQEQRAAPAGCPALCRLSPPSPSTWRRVHTPRHAPAVLVTSNSSFFRGTSLSLSNAALDYEGKSGGCRLGQTAGQSAPACSPGKHKGWGHVAERRAPRSARSTPRAGRPAAYRFVPSLQIPGRRHSTHGNEAITAVS